MLSIRTMFAASFLALASLAQAEANFKIIDGPGEVQVGDMATLKLPEGWQFVPKESMKEFDAATQNLYVETELGVLMAPKGQAGGFWAFFEFEDIGYIKDAASEKMDPDDMWTKLKEGDVAANEERK